MLHRALCGIQSLCNDRLDVVAVALVVIVIVPIITVLALAVVAVIDGGFSSLFYFYPYYRVVVSNQKMRMNLLLMCGCPSVGPIKHDRGTTRH